MSQTRKAVAALFAVTVSTAVGIGYIHLEQTEERKKLHEGVLRDQELLRRKEEQLFGTSRGSKQRK